MTHPSRVTANPAGETFSSQFHTPPANTPSFHQIETAKPIIPEILTTAFRFIQTLLHKAGEMLGLTKKIN